MPGGFCFWMTLLARLTLLRPRVEVLRSAIRPSVTSTNRLRGRAWVELRARVLRADPLCVECRNAGRLTPATEVDHVIPLMAGGGDDLSNLRGLCHACHTAKTATEQGMARGFQAPC
jgi:5-methylcytosine-specific restriction protein A